MTALLLTGTEGPQPNGRKGKKGQDCSSYVFE